MIKYECDMCHKQSAKQLSLVEMKFIANNKEDHFDLCQDCMKKLDRIRGGIVNTKIPLPLYSIGMKVSLHDDSLYEAGVNDSIGYIVGINLCANINNFADFLATDNFYYYEIQSEAGTIIKDIPECDISSLLVAKL